MKSSTRNLVTVIVSLAISSCALGKAVEIDQNHAISIAKQELARRHLTLPPGFMVSIREGHIVEEPGIKQTYVIDFKVRTNNHEKTFYTVVVNRRNGVAETVLNRLTVRTGI
jgi:hypothetical protein